VVESVPCLKVYVCTEVACAVLGRLRATSANAAKPDFWLSLNVIVSSLGAFIWRYAAGQQMDVQILKIKVG
jgi:hypothetical protein